MACEGLCLEVPKGWQGPAIMRRGETPVDCEGDFDIELAQANRNLIAPEASCECTCGDATGMGCSNIQNYRYDFHDGFFCPGIPSTFGSGTLCESVLGGAGPGGLLQLDVDDGFAPPGSCDPVAEVEIESATWGETVSFCGGQPEPGTCDLPSQQCAADDLELCVFQAGEADCRDAAPFYNRRNDVFTDISDDRSCSECACSQPTGGCLIESVELFDGLSCSPLNSVGEVSVDANDGCVSVPDVEVERFQITELLPPPAGSVSCDAVGGTPSGAASPSGQLTVCCLPPIAQ